MGEEFILGSTIPVAAHRGGDREAVIPSKDKYERLHNELADYYSEMREFSRLDSVEIFERLSAWTARASEIRNEIVQDESRRSNNFRTKQIEPFIDECDRQFRYHSRITAIHELDAKLAGGRFT